MKKQTLTYEKIVKENLDLAIKIQRAIFPNENGAVNLQIYTDKSLVEKYYGARENYREIFAGWICKNEDGQAVGLTGLYSYFEYPEDGWLGWYGVLPEHRRLGYGSDILFWTMEKAKSLGFKNLRLYTDIEEDATAVSLYRKIGMTEEKYTAEDMGDVNIAIFSKNLHDDTTKEFGNKTLFLKEQQEIQKTSGEIKL